MAAKLPCFLCTIFFSLLVFFRVSSCVGSAASCDYEALMGSETSTRFLKEQRRYISLGALKKDRPICYGGAPGAPYSSGGGSGCLPQPSNSYSRGCSKYYRCRSDA